MSDDTNTPAADPNEVLPGGLTRAQLYSRIEKYGLAEL